MRVAGQIFVDTKRDAILVPIYGVPVPFHIATVKSVALTKGEDGGEWSRLRINFNLPGQGQGARIDVGVRLRGRPLRACDAGR